MKPKVHFANIRLRVNAGITLPECKAHSARPLNMDASGLAMSGTRAEVTCKRCNALLDRHAFLNNEGRI